MYINYAIGTFILKNKTNIPTVNFKVFIILL